MQTSWGRGLRFCVGCWRPGNTGPQTAGTCHSVSLHCWWHRPCQMSKQTALDPWKRKKINREINTATNFCLVLINNFSLGFLDWSVSIKYVRKGQFANIQTVEKKRKIQVTTQTAFIA